MRYAIEYSPAARVHLNDLTKHDQQMVLDGVERHLSHQPFRTSRNLKRMRPNLLADWELRLGDLWVYYVIREPPINRVSVVAVGIKVGNRVSIAGEDISI
jgi:mRNA-degrading endonuclease RelE of RelBE toxin-antitoxin system